ncbi:MAG: sigma-70 family RNA polymerase sigma factor [Candidatus Omnitrophica bacterium]|nr:sigma-70 family RNA polymerase sigma factor [Candidatus Omnitrophota bacterium]
MNKERIDWVTELSETYGRMVFSSAYKVLGNPQDAEDVLQEVFLKLLGGWGKRIKPDAVHNWGAYLRVTAVRCAVDLLRRKPNFRQESWDYVREIEAPGENSPRFLASQKQKAGFLRQALNQLPERDSKIFAMRYFEDLSYDDIAGHLKINVNQVGVILHRTRERLKEILQPIESSFDRQTSAAPDRSRTSEEEAYHA